MAKTFKISFGSGFAWKVVRFVQVEDWEHEQNAIDKMIDKFEDTEDMGFFVNPDEYPEDEYIIGGNHCLALYHGGNLHIERV